MNRLISITLGIFFPLMSCLQADQNDDCCDCSNSCCPPKDPCASCAQLWPTCGPDWIVTPNAGPCVSNGADLFITGEFIYWIAQQDGMEFAVTNQMTTNAVTHFSEKGKLFVPDFRLEPGFKVGLGVFFDCDGWDVYANYTWLRTRKTDETAKPSDQKMLDSLIVPFAPNTTKISVSSQWDHDFNVIDLELGRNFFISQCLHLRPHFGLKGTWQKQCWDVDGISQQQATSTTIDNLKTVTDFELDYWGIGIRGGLVSAWHFNPCFSLIGELAATALWQRFDSEVKSFVHNLTTGFFSVSTNQENTFHSIKAVLEFYLGFRLENWWCCDEYHGSIDAGWEVQWWGSQNKFIIPNNTIVARGGDLGLQGFTLKVRFDF